MKVVFMGTPDFAVPSLNALLDAGHQVEAVFTQPDKAKGRGKKIICSPVKELAVSRGIPVYQPPKVREEAVVEQIRSMAPDVIVVVAFGQILPKAILDIPVYGCINVHGSLLPKYRGAAPVQWAVIEGEKVSGVTTMYMDTGLDTGDMIMKQEIPLAPKETGGSLYEKLAGAGAGLLIETLRRVEAGTADREKQDGSQAGAYAKMLDKHMGNIDFTQPAAVIERLIRGLNPWPSAYTHFHGKTMKIWEADVTDQEYEGACGEIVEVTKDALTVKTGVGALIIRELQMEGKKRMRTDAFLRGFAVKKGESFSQE
ncbi:MAG TPA: methionyl-tRNA formyltransferase [Candidatus Scybalocola faecipullorum]|nr:methionyl-tRNA formyltransferase [Candidatus Scybalocola faecipullorum]